MRAEPFGKSFQAPGEAGRSGGGHRDVDPPPSVVVKRMTQGGGEASGRETAEDVQVSEISPARVAHPHHESHEHERNIGR